MYIEIMNRGLVKFYSNLALLCTAVISGLSFVAQKAGMEFVGPFTFNTLRALLGALSLLPIISFLKIKSLSNDERTIQEKSVQHKTLARGGFLCGCMLFLALTINQFCMIYAPAGKAGFITSLYIIFVPLIAVFLKHKLRINVKLSVALALMGLYFLCYKQGTPVALSDIFLLISSFFFALHIIVVGRYSQKTHALKLACVQFVTVGLLSLPLMLIMEKPSVEAVIAGLSPILFSGVIVTGLAYTMQILGQKNTTPVIASLILSLESVFAVVGGILFLGESLSVKEILGCVLMIAAIILSQIRIPRRRKRV